MYLFVQFFFFKQKTAYEMRISDWSSDVCSSDLLGAVGLHRQQRTGLGGVAVDVDDAGAALAGVAADMGPGQAQVLAQELNEQSAGLDQIGRASWRDRVCQYV